jgi:hypothetical protein
MREIIKVLEGVSQGIERGRGEKGRQSGGCGAVSL